MLLCCHHRHDERSTGAKQKPHRCLCVPLSFLGSSTVCFQASPCRKEAATLPRGAPVEKALQPQAGKTRLQSTSQTFSGCILTHFILHVIIWPVGSIVELSLFPLRPSDTVKSKPVVTFPLQWRKTCGVQ